MIFKKRILAPVIVGSTLAGALTAMAAVAINTGSSLAAIEDVQIGERDQQTRVVFFCGDACALEKTADNKIFLRGAGGAFNLDLSAKKTRLAAVGAKQSSDGLLVDFIADGEVENVSVKQCTVGGRSAACLDLFFTPDKITTAAVSEKKQTHEAKSDVRDKIEPKAEAVTPEPAQVVTASAPPPLREGAEDRLDKFAGLASPERLEPPLGAMLAKLQPIEEKVEVKKPAIRQETAIVNPVRADYAAEIRTLLGKELTPAYCNNAEATLQADAWALGAMVDVGLCAAARGDVVEADAVLARLLEYTPDNYEAFVGRALIAQGAGEKGVAKKYFQDALNALPPIEESNRIVNAMAAL